MDRRMREFVDSLGAVRSALLAAAVKAREAGYRGKAVTLVMDAENIARDMVNYVDMEPKVLFLVKK